MKIYILRHGQAQPKHPAIKEQERELTKEGIENTRNMLLMAKVLGTEVERIVSSPYRRAVQTAAIAKEVFRPKELEVIENDVLKPDSTPYEVSTYLAKLSSERILLVSHQPLLGELFRSYVGGELDLTFPPSSMARIDVNESGKLEGTLVWLLSSDILNGKAK